MIENILAKYEGKALLTSKIGQYTEGVNQYKLAPSIKT